MTTRGLLLGKFMPPHAGHLFMTRVMRAMTDEQSILVCSTDFEPIDGAMRAQWMREAAPFAQTLHLHRNLPQAPEEDENFWPLWRTAINETHPEPITHVFGSKAYVFRLAAELGAAPMLIDPDREIYPVSASAIRAAPLAHWDMIAPPARVHYQHRLCLLGPESTGKSVLAKKLADSFGTRAMPEYGRAYDLYYKQKGLSADADWRAQDLIDLAKTHAAMRDALAPEAGPLLIEDTDAIQTAVWAEHLLGAPVPEIEAMAASAQADHYLLLTPEAPWVQDGIRYAGEDAVRQWFFEAAKARLEKLGASFDVIAGADFGRRSAMAMEASKSRFADCLPVEK